MPLHLQRNPVICAAELDGEVCLFHPDRGEYLNLNTSGSAIWNLLDTPLEREELIARLLDLYEVEEAACRRDTESFLARALEREMLLEAEVAP